MRELSRSFKPHIWVNVHSGMEVTQLFCSVDILYVTRNTKLDQSIYAPKPQKKNGILTHKDKSGLHGSPPVSKLLSSMVAILALINLGYYFFFTP